MYHSGQREANYREILLQMAAEIAAGYLAHCLPQLAAM